MSTNGLASRRHMRCSLAYLHHLILEIFSPISKARVCVSSNVKHIKIYFMT